MNTETVNINKLYRVGALDQRVQILSPTETQGANNEVTQTWGNYGTRYANVVVLTGNEPVIGDMLQPFSRAKFIFRYDANITEKCRLVWNSHTYNIVFINPVQRNRFLEIIAESYSLSGSEGVDYGDYYSTNSLKMRVVTGSAVSTSVPTSAEVTSDVGLTPAAAGNGYVCFINVYGQTYGLMVISDGTYWYRYKSPEGYYVRIT